MTLEQKAYESGEVDGMYRITATPNVDGILLHHRQGTAVEAYRRGLEQGKARTRTAAQQKCSRCGNWCSRQLP